MRSGESSNSESLRETQKVRAIGERRRIRVAASVQGKKRQEASSDLKKDGRFEQLLVEGTNRNETMSRTWCARACAVLHRTGNLQDFTQPPHLGLGFFSGAICVQEECGVDAQMPKQDSALGCASPESVVRNIDWALWQRGMARAGNALKRGRSYEHRKCMHAHDQLNRCSRFANPRGEAYACDSLHYCGVLLRASKRLCDIWLTLHRWRCRRMCVTCNAPATATFWRLHRNLSQDGFFLVLSGGCGTTVAH